MNIFEENLSQGFVKVVPDSLDALWHLYKVIYKDDEVYAFSSRARSFPTNFLFKKTFL
jgi:stalled ribosome rescue protein Dom34